MKLRLFAIALGAAFFVLLPWHPYPFSFVLKPSGILVLALIAVRSDIPYGRGLALGLVLGAGGDILLDVDMFTAGLVSFLLSHLVYATLFVLVIRDAGKRQTGALPWLLILGAVSASLLVWLLPTLGDMTVPVAAYFVVITVMAGLAILAPFNSLRLPIGAVLFVFSDSIIGINKFHGDVFGADQIIWISYFAAQYFILTGFVAGWARSGRMRPSA